MESAGNLKDLGLFLKTHGIEGGLFLKLFFLTENELKEGDPVFVEIDGLAIPFFISGFRLLSDNTAIVRLDEVDSGNRAAELVNCRVLIESSTEGLEAGDGNMEYDQLTGFRVIDEKRGDSGVLERIIEYPDNPVMQIILEGREILVPFNENIVQGIDHDARTINITAPDGLFDLYI